MTKIEDGGPAFPSAIRNWNDSVSVKDVGLSLRDWFAGQALSGMLANDTREGSWAAYAADAYAFADAMLAKRSERGEPTP